MIYLEAELKFKSNNKLIEFDEKHLKCKPNNKGNSMAFCVDLEVCLKYQGAGVSDEIGKIYYFI